MRSSTLALVAVLAVGFLPAGRVDAAPTRTLRGRLQRGAVYLRRAKRAWAQTGVVATAEAQFGVGAIVAADVGFRITPKDVATGKRKAGVFTSGEGHLVLIGARGTTSFDPSLRGIEKRYGPVGHGSPLYGDRLTIPIVPDFFSVFAGRSGGLGFRLSIFPLLTGPLAYLGRWGGTIYVTNPKLAPAAGWVLAKSDWVEGKLKKYVLEPAKSRWNRFKLRLRSDEVENS